MTFEIKITVTCPPRSAYGEPAARVISELPDSSDIQDRLADNGLEVESFKMEVTEVGP